MIKQAVFMLIKTKLNSLTLVESLRNLEFVLWADSVYGPYQIIVYAESENEESLIGLIENIRSRAEVNDLDARRVKVIPRDDELAPFNIDKSVSAALLINVNYKEEKERVVTWNLRKIPGVKIARAMWGPTDIISIVEASDHETMRNLICDEIKTMRGVMSNTTLYCYPRDSISQSPTKH